MKTVKVEIDCGDLHPECDTFTIEDGIPEGEKLENHPVVKEKVKQYLEEIDFFSDVSKATVKVSYVK